MEETVNSDQPAKDGQAGSRHKLLVLDTSYTLEMVQSRGLKKPILCRDLDGYFDHVWSVHPFATLVTSDDWGLRFGPPDHYEFASRHTIIEGRVGRFRWLRWLFLPNFLLAQIDLFVRLLLLIRRKRISVIRAPSPLYAGLFALGLARLSGVPLVIRVGANHDELRKFTGKPVEPRFWRGQRIEKAVERFVLSRASLVAGANQNNLEFALSNGADPSRSTIFRYGNLIDSQHFVDPAIRPRDAAILRELGLGDEPFIISVGRLEDVAAVKHPGDVVSVLASLRADGVAAKAIWVGEGPLRDDLTMLAAKLGVHDQFVFAGNRNQEWLAKVFPLAAVHVCTQAGRALSEGALAALPTVAYDIDWQRELIETGVTGILVRYRDRVAMAAGVKRLIENRGEAKRMGKSLRQRALQMLSPDMLTKHERAEYSKLLGRVRS